jgi:hypothetical protein
MNSLENLFDPYERRARLAPMLIALAPVIIPLVLYVPGISEFSLKSVGAIFLYGTVSILLTTQARQAGKRLEPKLRTEWGGWPSMMIFRHRDSWIDPITKANIHKAMSKVVASTNSPTPEEEVHNPTECDFVYQAWSEHLRKLARNERKKFPFVFRESISYGFQRNLYGLKVFAIAIVVITTAIISGVSWQKYKASEIFPTPELVCLSILVLTILFWIFAVTKTSVKRAAYDYASRLIDDCVPYEQSSTARRRRKGPDIDS